MKQITRWQLDRIYQLAHVNRWTMEQLGHACTYEFGILPAYLTEAEADDMIRHLELLAYNDQVRNNYRSYANV